MTATIDHFVGGRRVAPSGNRFGDVFDPSTGAVQARVPLASDGEVDTAVAAARAAFPEWAATAPPARARILFRFQMLLRDHLDELARIVSSEHGKTLDDARGSVTRGIEVVEFACGIPQLLKGEHNEGVASGIDSYSFRQPLGVCAGITPFNFPAMVPMWMFPVAIACGNTFVLKPSERDPSTAVRIAELAAQAGLPPGVLNVLHGDREAVDALIAHPGVDAVSFVGSTPIAERVYRAAAQAGKRVQALGGAKNHLVVMPDADLDQTVEALMGSAYGSAGERCMAVSVRGGGRRRGGGRPSSNGSSPESATCASAASTIRRLKWAPWLPAPIEAGSRATWMRGWRKARISSWTAAGSAPRTAATGAAERRPQAPAASSWRMPVRSGTPGDVDLHGRDLRPGALPGAREELRRGAVARQRSRVRNGAAIFTRDGDTARDFTTRAKIGMIGVNVPIPVPSAFHSFGGWKRSLFGDHYMHGPEGVRFYTRLKTITQRWPSGARERAEFSIPTHR